MERGARNLSLESISKLAVALDISVSDLFSEEVQIGKTNPPASPQLLKSIPGKDAGRANHKHYENLVNILLVEDNPDDAELTLQAFKKSRFANRVQVVHDGEEALDFLFCRRAYAHRRTADNPDLILLDLNLPKLAGLEVLRRIKADRRTRTIPVAILTVSEMFSDMEECQQLGAETFIVKPVNFQRLSQVTPQLKLNWALFKPVRIDLRNARV